jgi:hypothetical protein
MVDVMYVEVASLLFKWLLYCSSSFILCWMLQMASLQVASLQVACLALDGWFDVISVVRLFSSISG